MTVEQLIEELKKCPKDVVVKAPQHKEDRAGWEVVDTEITEVDFVDWEKAVILR